MVSVQHITSSNPMVDPEYDPRYFEHESDLNVLMETAKFTCNLVQHAPLKDMIAREITPKLGVQTDEQFTEYVKQTFGMTWYTCSTCLMTLHDKGGVIDHELRVHGTNNLRVVDLSIVPLHIAAHTQCMYTRLSVASVRG
ncbi:uncharacterized protein PHACADRAFT_87795 [Phanerochaete carnosa HHB-10118-sp]|uniref:C2H2-type domain-containing protein n=1 Tax=Phanerochaete carnosa (strain HHB-10118-sp) TaxID=650164 RepID=K5VB02_PHACS|nr:uncharacterized protein PHACADRAFT_87795 [Phanerochaete carnosa HHB-10118-sp]EKM60056.1 hypothetical protein PHACADRAFT_87795 [Phanerochaete carnosa HHB-10118-sp]